MDESLVTTAAVPVIVQSFLPQSLGGGCDVQKSILLWCPGVVLERKQLVATNEVIV